MQMQTSASAEIRWKEGAVFHSAVCLVACNPDQQNESNL